MLVIVSFRSVVQHRHDVRIVVLVVIVERIEEDAETVPLVGAAEDRALEALSGSEPKGETVSPDSTATCYPKFDKNFPPVICAEKKKKKASL